MDIPAGGALNLGYELVSFLGGFGYGYRLHYAGVFHEIPRIDEARLTEFFAREVLAFLVGLELLSPEWAERILLMVRY